ncbi:MAG TPA: phosphoribosylanthranilate isomerase [Chloroflexota bacterium]
MTRVKICGLRRVEDCLAAADAGADFIGFIFAPSRRRIEPENARDVISQVRAQSDVKAVGVFVNARPEEMNRVARLCTLDYAQLSGDEGDDVVRALDVPAIQVFHVHSGTSDGALVERIERSSAALVLLDSASQDSFGGTGKAFDWAAIPPLQRPFLLAGGLDARNVESAIDTVAPWGVDVSSGVERDGQKSADMVREFIAVVRSRPAADALESTFPPPLRSQP